MKGICPILAALKGPAVLASHRFGLRKPASLEDEPGNYSADIREYRGCTLQEQERFRLVARRKSELFPLLDPSQWDFLDQFGEAKVARLASF